MASVDRPVLFIGMPRSGTTLLFAGYTAHPDLGWFSQYVHRFPRFPQLAAISRLVDRWPAARATSPPPGKSRTPLDRLRIMPSETAGDEYGAWSHCCGSEIATSFLIDAKPSAAARERLRSTVATTLRYQGKPRFAGKLTGPPRIGYLDAIFPDAYFVHIVRDPRSIVESLLRVPFWRQTFRYTEPAWTGGLGEEEMAKWSAAGSSPAALAAIEWGVIVKQARLEAASLPSERYVEMRYEDFVAEPHETLDALFNFSALRPSPGSHQFLDERLAVRNLSGNWASRLSEADVKAVTGTVGDVMAEFSYSAS